MSTPDDNLAARVRAGDLEAFAELVEQFSGMLFRFLQRLLPRADGEGRIAAHEVLLGTPAVRELIADQRFRELPGCLAEGEGDGMWTMKQCLRRLVEAGLVHASDAG